MLKQPLAGGEEHPARSIEPVKRAGVGSCRGGHDCTGLRRRHSVPGCGWSDAAIRVKTLDHQRILGPHVANPQGSPAGQ